MSVLSINVRRVTSASLLLLAVLWWCAVLWRSHGELYFDDAYMFYRYAEHFKQGLGFSWNLDGIHTYGMTSLLWLIMVLAFSLLPLTAAHCLLLASWLMSGLAIVLTSFAIWHNARSSWLRSPATVIAFVALSSLSLKIFRINARTGMETTLAMALLALLIGLVISEVRRPVLIGLVAFLLVLARPEAALPVFMILLLSSLLLPGISFGSAAKSLAVLAFGIAITLLLTKAYFHSWFPLSFYLKSRDGYIGYRFRWYPVTSAVSFLRASGLYLLLIAHLYRRKEWRIILLCLLPLAATMLYLCTVTQIMGMASRYYMPYLPLLAVPAYLVLDARLHELESNTRIAFQWRPSYLVHATLGILIVLFLADGIPKRLQAHLETLAERRVLSYNEVVLSTPAAVPLPEIGYDRALHGFADDLVSGLPDGATIAATEVGYLGAQFPRINVIDLAGLNDNNLALHGFSSTQILRRSPDLIWLPHNDYTWHRGILLTDPVFLPKYEVYSGAMNYGIAILKSSRYKDFLEFRLAKVWPQLYPTSAPDDHLVQKVAWDRSTFVPAVEPVVR
jgi:hypothetical protein